MLLEKNITIDIPTTQTPFNLDPVIFKQILSNVLSNAIKFSHQNGHIFISIQSKDTNLTILVSDQGIGIPDSLIDNIFDVFTSSRRSGTSGEKATGLGLSITKRLVELHAGKISIFSNTLKGATVKIVFAVN